MDVEQFLSQPFVQGQHGDFRGSIADIARACDEAGHACDLDDVTMVVFEHPREEFLDQEKVGHDVDVEEEAQSFLALIQDGCCRHGPGIVYQNGRVSVISADLVCNSLDAFGRGEVHLVEISIGS